MVEEIEDKDLIDILNNSQIIYTDKENIVDILEYLNVILLEKVKRTDDKKIKYINSIEIVNNTVKRIRANSNYDMCIDNMLINIWEEINK